MMFYQINWIYTTNQFLLVGLNTCFFKGEFLSSNKRQGKEGRVPRRRTSKLSKLSE